MHVYKITRADGKSKYYSNLSGMLDTFDKDDVLNLHRLILVDPKEDDDIWKNQQEWKMISWKLYETCGVHTLMVDGTLMTIHMFVVDERSLTKETLKKMLNWRLEVDHESTMAYELIKFIRSQVQKKKHV
ncbi:hypothetical protein Tco_0829856 [Tanacetum coccineum]